MSFSYIVFNKNLQCGESFGQMLRRRAKGHYSAWSLTGAFSAVKRQHNVGTLKHSFTCLDLAKGVR